MAFRLYFEMGCHRITWQLEEQQGVVVVQEDDFDGGDNTDAQLLRFPDSTIGQPCPSSDPHPTLRYIGHFEGFACFL